MTLQHRLRKKSRIIISFLQNNHRPSFAATGNRVCHTEYLSQTGGCPCLFHQPEAALAPVSKAAPFISVFLVKPDRSGVFRKHIQAYGFKSQCTQPALHMPKNRRPHTPVLHARRNTKAMQNTGRFIWTTPVHQTVGRVAVSAENINSRYLSLHHGCIQGFLLNVRGEVFPRGIQSVPLVNSPSLHLRDRVGDETAHRVQICRTALPEFDVVFISERDVLIERQADFSFLCVVKVLFPGETGRFRQKHRVPCRGILLTFCGTVDTIEAKRFGF